MQTRHYDGSKASKDQTENMNSTRPRPTPPNLHQDTLHSAQPDPHQDPKEEPGTFYVEGNSPLGKLFEVLFNTVDRDALEPKPDAVLHHDNDNDFTEGREREDYMLDILEEVMDEVNSAVAKHPTPFHSPMEGYAIIKEELDELWDEIKADRGDARSARKEAVQIAAMAIRYLLDIDPA